MPVASLSGAESAAGSFDSAVGGCVEGMTVTDGEVSRSDWVADPLEGSAAVGLSVVVCHSHCSPPVSTYQATSNAM